MVHGATVIKYVLDGTWNTEHGVGVECARLVKQNQRSTFRNERSKCKYTDTISFISLLQISGPEITVNAPVCLWMTTKNDVFIFDTLR